MTVGSIVVQGSQRVDADTIRSYFRPGPGGRLDAFQIDDGVKSLYATGLFQDVRPSMQGGRLIIFVVENPVINRIAFEGNRKVKDEQLKAEIQSKERGTLSRPTVQADVARLVDVYRRGGRFDVRVEPKIIELANNRVDLVFEISEGGKTGVKRIEFIGNKFYSDYRLQDVIKTSQTGLLSFLQTSDIYDPDRIEADRELLRRFYLKHGFIDVRIISAVGEYDPARRGFMITFTIEEGEQYKVASVEVQSNVRSINPALLRPKLRAYAGDVYNAELVEKSVEDMTIEASRLGFAFATVRPRATRNPDNRTVSLFFVIDEGQRAYIERINVRGNTRTRDYVIRREFDLSEGDAYNRALVNRAERRLKNLVLLQERADYPRARLGARPRHPQRRPRGDVDRRILRVRRLLDLRRHAGRGQRRRAQPAGPRTLRQGIGAVRPKRQRLHGIARRAVLPRLSPGARSRHLRQAAELHELRLVQLHHHRLLDPTRVCVDRKPWLPGPLLAVPAIDLAARSV